MGCRKGGRRRKRYRFREGQGVLGSEAGYSQAAPVAIWRHKLLAVILATTDMQLSNRAFCSE